MTGEGELALDVVDGGDPVVEDGGGEHRGGSGVEGRAHVDRGAGTAARDEGDGGRRREGAEQLDVVSLACPVAVPAGGENLAGAEADRAAGPLDGVGPGATGAARDDDLPARGAARALGVLAARGVQGEHRALGAEARPDLADQLGALEGRGVHGDLVRPGVEEPRGVLDAPHAAAHRERDADGGAHGADGRHGARAALTGGRDVEEAELVGAGRRVGRRALHGVARVAEALEADALHDPAVLHVEAGDDSEANHQATPPEQVSAARSSQRSRSAAP